MNRIKIVGTTCVCKQCKKEKLKSDFHKDSSTVAGIRAICKTCVQENRQADPKKAKRKEWRDAQDKRLLRAGAMVSILRKLGYVVTKTDYLNILDEAGTICPICENEFIKTPSMDHCHSTNKIRGLICNDCNIALGLFKDSKVALLNAIRYLEDFETSPNKYEKYRENGTAE